MRKKQLFFIFITALLVSVTINEINLAYIKAVNKSNKTINAQSTVHSSTVWSIDNSWYLPYIKNMINGDGFTLDPNEPEMSVRRTPIYPLFYGSIYYVFGEKWCHFIIRYIQIFLFSLSAILMALSVFYIFKSKRWAIIAGYTYAINPFIYSYCYFTLTESISPFMVVLSLYFFSRYLNKDRFIDLILCGATSSLAFLTRPTTGVIVVGFCAYILFNKGLLNSINNKIKLGAVFAFSFILILSPWAIRNYILTGEIIVAEKIYHGAPMNYGRGHVELRYLTSCWTNPANLSTEEFSGQLITNIKNNEQEKNYKVIQSYLDKWPEVAFAGFTRNDLEAALFSLNNCYIEKDIYQKKNPLALRKDYLNLPCIDKTFNELNMLKKQFIKKSPLRYYILTPLKTIKEIVFNSFLHHFAIINPIDKSPNIFQFITKSLVYLLNVLFYLSLVYFLAFSKSGFKNKILLFAPVCILLLALTVVLFRYVETRYLLPIYPLLVISFSYMLYDLSNKVRSYFGLM